MKKKILLILSATLISFSLVACGTSSNTEADNQDNTEVSQETDNYDLSDDDSTDDTEDSDSSEDIIDESELDVATSDEDNNTETLNEYYPMMESYETAINDLWGRYQNGTESAQTSAKRLSGLANGIQNTVNGITAESTFHGQDQMVGLATAYKVIADRYSEYITTGDQSVLDDANGMIERAAELKKEVKSLMN